MEISASLRFLFLREPLFSKIRLISLMQSRLSVATKSKDRVRSRIVLVHVLIRQSPPTSEVPPFEILSTHLIGGGTMKSAFLWLLTLLASICPWKVPVPRLSPFSLVPPSFWTSTEVDSQRNISSPTSSFSQTLSTGKLVSNKYMPRWKEEQGYLPTSQVWTPALCYVEQRRAVIFLVSLFEFPQSVADL